METPRGVRTLRGSMHVCLRVSVALIKTLWRRHLGRKVLFKLVTLGSHTITEGYQGRNWNAARTWMWELKQKWCCLLACLASFLIVLRNDHQLKGGTTHNELQYQSLISKMYHRVAYWPIFCFQLKKNVFLHIFWWCFPLSQFLQAHLYLPTYPTLCHHSLKQWLSTCGSQPL